jgi:SAM-dependent methyltransferase
MDEPLTLIAPLAAEMAPQHCRKDDLSGESCAWYHGSIGYLRLLGVMSSPAEDRGFLTTAFARLAQDGTFRRVLVSGAGDCSMLAQLVAGFASAGAVPSVTLIDRCPTPVRLNAWLAERCDLPLAASVADIREFESAELFDVICTHCFLGYFALEERPRLFAKWFSLLRPGGYLVTVNPVRTTADHSFLGFSAAQAASFRERALAALHADAGLFPCGTTTLQQRVDAFTANFGSYPVRSAAELAGLFEAAGFVVETCHPLPGSGSGSGAPGEHGPAYHAVVARRP